MEILITWSLRVPLDMMSSNLALTQSAPCRWTNGVCKSTLHRVVTDGTKERYSTAFFMEPNFHAVSAHCGGLVALWEGSQYRLPIPQRF